MKILHAVEDIRNAVSEVLGDPASARYAIVAFVGCDPLRWIPHPKGLQVYCWPRAGGTNPDGIDALINAGATVHFKESLHSKVYHCESTGTVIGSANLSDNALGTGRLTETAIQLPAGAFRLDEQMKGLDGSVASDAAEFLPLMDKLRREHVAYYQRNPEVQKGTKKGTKRSTGKGGLTFGQWALLGENSRAPWQLGLWFGSHEPPQDVLEEFKETGGINFVNWRAHHDKKHLEIGVATLDCEYQTNTWGIRTRGIQWWFPQAYKASNEPEWQEMPHVWYTSVNVPSAVSVPFDSSEPRFLEALANAVSEFGEESGNLKGRVKGKFLKLLIAKYLELP